MASNEEIPAIYLKSLYLENFRCFKDEYTISLTDKQGKPAQWTVFLGNNNTGKTSILKAIANLEVKERVVTDSEEKKLYNNHTRYQPRYSSKGEVWNKDFLIGIDIFISSAFKGNISKNTYFELKTYKNPIHFIGERKAYGNISIKNNTYSLTAASISSNNEKIDFQKIYPLFKIYGYGTSRKSSASNNINSSELFDTTIGLFSDTQFLLNVEEWLLQLDYATKNNAANAKKVFSKVKSILTSEILPDINDIRFRTTKDFQNFLEIKTDYGWVKFRDLGYGYQTTIAWLADLAKRMFDRYPELENPLHGPAIVLIDEIDLHLHPEWQRKIIKYLSDLFPNTQFIVTAHSPLIVQSAENVNLVMLEKDEATGSINVRQQFGSFQGWTVEEILRELMDLGEKTRSDRYLELMREFEDSLLEENYAGAKTAYEELDKILSPSSHQRKVLQIQMSSLIPA